MRGMLCDVVVVVVVVEVGIVVVVGCILNLIVFGNTTGSMHLSSVGRS